MKKLFPLKDLAARLAVSKSRAHQIVQEQKWETVKPCPTCGGQGVLLKESDVRKYERRK